jgi:hypothetical protein
MIEFGCGECGTALVAIASTIGDSGPYPTAFLSCRRCGAAWEQGSNGSLVKRRDRLVHAASVSASA